MNTDLQSLIFGRFLFPFPSSLFPSQSSSQINDYGEMFVKKPTSACREVTNWVIQRWDSFSSAKFLLMLLKRSDIWNQFWTSWWLFSSETHSLLKTLKGSGASLVVQLVKNPPEMQETWVQSVGKIPLEEGMATHSSILDWRIPWTEEPGGLQSMGSQRDR